MRGGGWRRTVWRGERGVNRRDLETKTKSIAKCSWTQNLCFCISYLFLAPLNELMSEDKKSEGIWQEAVAVWK